MKKKVLAILLAACMIVSLLPAATAASFGDTEGHWSSESVNRWADAGVLSGDGTGNFQPDKEMTRAEFAQMLCNLMGYTEKAENTFSDVPDDAWYADAILKLNAAGVMSGVGGGKAGANELISREQAAVMLCRAMNIKPSQGASISFGDAGSVSTWARDAVAALTERGMINGVGGNSFAPALNINKASVAAMVDNMVAEYVTENGATITGEVSGVVIIKADNVKLENATLSENVIVAPAAADATVSLTGTTEAAGVVVAAEGAKVVVAQTAAAGSVSVEAPRAEAQVAGKADAIVVAEAAEGAKVTVAKDAEVKDMTVAAPNTETQVAGKIENVTVAETAKDATVNTSSGAQVGSVTTEAEGTTVSGSGKVDSVTATGNADNTNVSTSGTKTENKTESGSMTDGKGNETKPGESGTSSGGTSSSGGGSSSGSGGGNSGGEEENPDTPKDPEITKPGTGTDKEDEREEEKGQEGTKTEATDPTAEEIAAAAEAASVGECTSEDKAHTWVKDTENAANEAPNCTKAGAVVYKCSSCNATVTVTVKALGHTTEANSKITITKQPSCTEEGEKTIICANCGETLKTEKIEKRAHEYKTGRYDTNDTQHWQLCDYCGTPSETKADHSWKKVDAESTEATCLVKGTTVSECACGAKKTEEVAKKEHAAAANAKWQTSETKHWKACATATCTAKVEEADHVWAKKTGKCDVCEMECPNKANHATIPTTGTCPTCGANGTKEPEATKYTISTPTPLPDGCASYKVWVNNQEVTSAAEGAEVVLQPNPASGYKIKTVSYTPDGEAAVTVNARMPDGGDTEVYSFTMPAKNITVSATFEKAKYTLSVADGIEGVTFTVGNTQNATEAAEGDTVTVVIPTGKTIASVTYTESGNSQVGPIEVVADDNGTYTFEMLPANVTVTVEFEETTSSGGGT